MKGKIIWDFFCGAGGFSLGFASKDNTVIGFDNNEMALKTYKYNLSKVYKEVTTFKWDIMKMNIAFVTPDNKGIPKRFVTILYENGKYYLPFPDIIIGSPPCQEFSGDNQYKTMDTTLVKKFLEIKNKIAPEWWVMEEVPAVGKLGLVKPRYLFAYWFNLPHSRFRLFAGNYPETVKKQYRGERIDTPKAEIRGYGNGAEKRNKIKRYYYMLKHGHYPSPGRVDKYTFEELVTIELYAYVMGFPDNYRFYGDKKQQYRQIGNAVCPPIAKAIYKAILKPQIKLSDYK